MAENRVIASVNTCKYAAFKLWSSPVDTCGGRDRHAPARHGRGRYEHGHGQHDYALHAHQVHARIRNSHAIRDHDHHGHECGFSPRISILIPLITRPITATVMA